MTRPSLAHDASPEAYAKAMIACAGYAPRCSDAGECERGGACFTSSGAGFVRARRAIDRLVEREADVSVRSWLRVALDALDHHRFDMRVRDALRYMEISRRIRAEYGERP